MGTLRERFEAETNHAATAYNRWTGDQTPARRRALRDALQRAANTLRELEPMLSPDDAGRVVANNMAGRARNPGGDRDHDHDHDALDPVKAARHEAGHAVMAWALGIPIYSVRIGKYEHSADYHSEGELRVGHMSYWPRRNRIMRRALLAVAGSIGEQMGQPFENVVTGTAERLIGGSSRNDCENMEKALLRLWRMHHGPDERLRDDDFQSELLDKSQAELTRIAYELLHQDRMRAAHASVTEILRAETYVQGVRIETLCEQHGERQPIELSNGMVFGFDFETW